MRQLTAEEIVLCAEDGTPSGAAPKLASHHAETPLHLGFSCYVFDASGRLLVTQRAHHKKVWPGVWTNTVCGHPMPGEAFDDAVRRRAHYELGMYVDALSLVLPRYRYVSPAYDGIVENEFCPVFVAGASTAPSLNPDEVAACRWMRWDDFVAEATRDDADMPMWSWWCRDQLKLLRREPAFEAAMSDAIARAEIVS